MISSKFRRIILLLISATFLFLPIILQKGLYFIGSDDLRLYYIYPDKYLENFALNIISDNTLGGANTGYYPTSQFVPLLYVIIFFKKAFPFFNTQSLMSGLNVSFAFLFFYLFISIWFKPKNNYQFATNILASFFYILSPFLVATQYTNQLTSVYLVSAIPASFYFFTRGVSEKKYIFSVISALIFTVFSAVINTLPWSLPMLICGLPVFIYIFVADKKSFIINTFVFGFFVLILNLHWLFHFVNSNINNTGVVASLEYFSSEEFKNENIRGILGVSRLLHPLVPLVMKLDYNFKENFNLVDLKNLVFILLISVGGIFASKTKTKKTFSVYLMALGCFLISWFMFSPNFGNWGPDLFLEFATTLPFATMFRNMFDKFALPLAFFYSFSVAASFFVIEKKAGKTLLKKITLLLFVLGVFINLKPFLNIISASNGNITTSSGEFNDDYVSLITYLENLDNESRVLWVPMTSANYVGIEDKFLEGHFYFGPSPLKILTGKGDYAGRFAFMLPSDIFYGDKLIEILKEGKYEEFAENMQKMNVSFVVIEKQKFPEYYQNYLFDADMKYLKFQSEEFRNVILGEKIKDFGERYSMYWINDAYASDRIFLTDSYEEFNLIADKLDYQKNASYSYDIEIKNLDRKEKLVFMDPYYKDWTLYLMNGNMEIPFENGKNEVVRDWANGWSIDPEEIEDVYNDNFYENNSDGSINLKLKLFFNPQKYNNFLYPFTAFSYLATFLLISFYVLKTKLR